MSIDSLWSPVDNVTDRWSALERDWQSVFIGVAIVVLVGAFELPIPW
ncbi:MULTISPECIES: hypothetical protein [Natronorubrum]|uniref:Uncharacterized protein n=2 Tax=Natronorubrum TaxID=134813 RepID=A0A1N7CSL7_9EURY|nr:MULTISPECIES: hypothetical protein [Natronorubrum]SEH16456.1 hypothetical protein SAMN04487967_2637 [Natronorubrum sediminis]SIR66425.1 hypothetical protein SAMN05421809_1856 [Natronorubrum daqingense]